MSNSNRESFGSRIGFLLVSAGCAIGIGNVWKFPWLVGQNGGAIFVLLYLVFLVVMGLPILTMELAVGRASGKSAVAGYKALEPSGSKWHIHGWFCIAGCFLLMMYYTTVSGWMLGYFTKFATGTFTSDMNGDAISGVFSGMLSDPKQMLIFMALTVLGGSLICSFSLNNGLERISKWMMLCLLILIVVLAVHSLMLPNASKGTSFYLMPSLERINSIGWSKAITAAMNQAFVTLSLGIGAMEIFGSYMSKKNTIAGEAARICGLDTFVAIMSGMIIFPACFSFGIEPDQGPALIFMTLPNVFVNMAYGQIWGTLFFLFMTFASFSTVIAVFENLIASASDNFGWSRKKAAGINCIAILIASVPCVLGYNIWSGFAPFGGMTVLDMEDFLVSNLLLPIGSLIYLLFCVTRWGWGFDKYLAEVNSGIGMKMARIFKPYFVFVLPMMILIIIITGLV